MACEEEEAALIAAQDAVFETADALADAVADAEIAEEEYSECLEGDEGDGEESAARSSKADWSTIRGVMRSLKSKLPDKK